MSSQCFSIRGKSILLLKENIPQSSRIQIVIHILANTEMNIEAYKRDLFVDDFDIIELLDCTKSNGLLVA